MASVELFYSYAHSDHLLCIELQKHLMALKRSGLISDWYDRRIEPGSEWSVEIKEAMERAYIILLLVSADFLASNYINDIEVPFALKRLETDDIKVIPVLLRKCDWSGLSFAHLQALPTGDVPVMSWEKQDEAFADIARSLRELLYNQRKPPIAVTRVTQERILDAAIAKFIVLDEPTDLVSMIRTTDSEGLKAILQDAEHYSPTGEDVRPSKPFGVNFPSNSSGASLPATLEIALESPGFDPPRQRKTIRLPPKSDSDVFVFMVTPKRAGDLKLNLEVLSENVVIGSCLLVTRSVSETDAPSGLSYGVRSLALDFEQSYDVFLSHNSAQKDWTRALARRLRDKGYRVFFDEWEMPRYAGRTWIK